MRRGGRTIRRGRFGLGMAARGVLLLVFLVACDHSRGLEGEEFFHDEEYEAGRISIAELRSRGTGVRYPISEDVWIEGHITANDLYGEFQGVVLEDATGGIEVALERSRFYGDYPIGATLRVRCLGLIMERFRGMGRLLQLTSGGSDYQWLDREAEAKHLQRLEREIDEREVREAEMNELGSLAAGWRVRLGRVAFVEQEQGLAWCDADTVAGAWRPTTRRITNGEGDTLAVYTLGGCHYASEPLPRGEGPIVGILDRCDTALFLRVSERNFW